MKPSTIIRKPSVAALLLVTSVALAACGGDDESPGGDGAVTPPDNPRRELPTAGPPEDQQWEAPDAGGFDFPDADPGQPVPACCPTTFAIADRDAEEDEAWVHLVGSATPLLGDLEAEHRGVEMTLADGVWSTTVCMPPGYAGTYAYEFGYGQPDHYDVYREANPAAPTGSGGGETYNTWQPAESCDEIDVSVHGQTATP